MGDGPDDLKEWALKDSDEQARVNLEGTYGKPVIHRGDCQGRYKKMPSGPRPSAMLMWKCSGPVSWLGRGWAWSEPSSSAGTAHPSA